MRAVVVAVALGSPEHRARREGIPRAVRTAVLEGALAPTSCLSSGVGAERDIGHWAAQLWMTACRSSRTGAAEPAVTAGRMAALSSRVAAHRCKSSRPGLSPCEDRAGWTDKAQRAVLLASGGCTRRCYAGCRPWTAAPPAYGHSTVPLSIAWHGGPKGYLKEELAPAVMDFILSLEPRSRSHI